MTAEFLTVVIFLGERNKNNTTEGTCRANPVLLRRIGFNSIGYWVAWITFWIEKVAKSVCFSRVSVCFNISHKAKIPEKLITKNIHVEVKFPMAFSNFPNLNLFYCYLSVDHEEVVNQQFYITKALYDYAALKIISERIISKANQNIKFVMLYFYNLHLQLNFEMKFNSILKWTQFQLNFEMKTFTIKAKLFPWRITSM